MLLLSRLLMLTVAHYGDVSLCVCIFNFETVSSLYRALYEVRLCIPNILDSIELHQAPGSRLHNRNIAKYARQHLLASSTRVSETNWILFEKLQISVEMISVISLYVWGLTFYDFLPELLPALALEIFPSPLV